MKKAVLYVLGILGEEKFNNLSGTSIDINILHHLCKSYILCSNVVAVARPSNLPCPLNIVNEINTALNTALELSERITELSNIAVARPSNVVAGPSNFSRHISQRILDRQLNAANAIAHNNVLRDTYNAAMCINPKKR